MKTTEDFIVDHGVNVQQIFLARLRFIDSSLGATNQMNCVRVLRIPWQHRHECGVDSKIGVSGRRGALMLVVTMNRQTVSNVRFLDFARKFP